MTEQMQGLEQFPFLFSQDGGYLRIPIWGHIPLSRPARLIIEHPDFVRLSRIRQLGFVHYVFPGASHTRFEHSIGTYHLSVQLLQRIVLNPVNWFGTDSPKLTPEDGKLFLAASLLHDIGHYPFAHLVDRLPGHNGVAFKTHEESAASYILADKSSGSIHSILKDDWGIAEPECVADIIVNPEGSGLPVKMLSGILDPDKMDYLMRDAWACGVPYGNIDTDRLIESLVLDVDDGRQRLGITEKGIAPLESLVFAKYMMFRHIYWHHAVRIAVAMFTRFMQDGLENAVVDPELFYSLSDDALIEDLSGLADQLSSGELILNLKNRNLYKRGIILYPEHSAGEEEFTISGGGLDRVKELYRQPKLRKDKEIAICKLLNEKEGLELRGFEVLLDIPRISSVFDLDDFYNLHVLVTTQAEGKQVFVPFNTYGFTQLTANFAQEFERYSRRGQVICRPDLKDALLRHRNEIKDIVTQ